MSLRDELLARFPGLTRVPPGSYVVGGAVRDLLFGADPVDVDVAAPDPLAAAQSISRRVIRLGTEDHLSAWRVVAGGHVFDFAQILDGSIEADLRRRDFTVNAIAVSLDDGTLLDPHGGNCDLSEGLVRMIEPSNFDDDPLRCLKAVRMAVRFGFTIDPPTLAAIRSRADRIQDVASERITYELSVIFSTNRFREAVRLLHETGLDVPLFGRELTATFHTDRVPLAAALALVGGLQWRWSTFIRRQVEALQRLAAMEGDRRVALFDAGEETALQLPPLLRALGRDANVPMPDFSIRALLSGEEISEMTGLPPGPGLGEIKRGLLEAQIRGEVSSRGEAEAFVRREVP